MTRTPTFDGMVVISIEQLREIIRAEVDAALREAQLIAPALVPARDAATMLGMDVRTLRRRAAQLNIEPQRIGRKVYYRRDDLGKIAQL